MGLCGTIVLIVAALCAVFIGFQVNDALQSPPIPQVDETFWGPGEPTPDDTAIVPFKINVSRDVLTDLKQRLDNHRPLTKALEGVKHNYGINSGLLAEVVEYWKRDYDWVKRQTYMNSFPQFKTRIQGLDMHYIHVKPNVGLKTIPLLLLHGWPGSVREFYEIIPLLTQKQEGKDFVFEVIAPSLPGYGFSQAAAKPGLGLVEMSMMMKNLMTRLGFEKYYVQGGDWGSALASTMGILYPDKVLGIHSNMCLSLMPSANVKLFLGSLYPTLFMSQMEAKYTYPLSTMYYYILLESGYSHIQATKPDTVGVGLNDSPIGLAAYILEKFITWTNAEYKDLSDGGLKTKFNYDKLLDNIMVYWITNSITTSMRLYAETLNIAERKYSLDAIPVKVPSVCSRFSKDLMFQPLWILKDKYTNMVHFKDYDDAGHFAAFEAPALVANDIFEGIKKML